MSGSSATTSAEPAQSQRSEGAAPAGATHARRRPKPELLFPELTPDQWPRFSRKKTMQGVAAVVGIFLLTRIVVWTMAYAGAIVNLRIQYNIEPPLEHHREDIARIILDPTAPEHGEFDRRLSHFSPLTNFDGQHYRSIIEKGYRYVQVTMDDPPMKRQQNIAFFPLYPLICTALSGLFNTNTAMVLAAHLAALLAGLVIYFWVRTRIDHATAIFCAACAFCLPSACYFSFAYAESTTLLLTALVLLLADRRKFWPAALLCGIATAARPTALGLAAVLALAFWLNAEMPRNSRLRRLIPLAALAVTGIAAYAVFLTVQYGSPLVYLKNFKMGWVPETARPPAYQLLLGAPIWNQFKYFGRIIEGFPAGLPWLLHPFTWNMPMSLFLLFLSLAGIPRVPKSFRPLLLLGPLIFLHSYLAGGGANFGMEPIGRYMAVAVPALVVLAAWCTREWRPGPRYAMLAMMLFIQAAWAFNFGLDEWSG